MIAGISKGISFTLLCLTITGGHSYAASIEKKRIAVLDFAANNVPVSHAKIVRNALEVALFNSDRFRLLEREQIETILRERRIRGSDLKGTENSIEIGKTIASDYVITGSVDKIGRPSITVRVVSVE
jgi:curli biogenesis system outer membrane secretion channel CsgG